MSIADAVADAFTGIAELPPLARFNVFSLQGSPLSTITISRSTMVHAGWSMYGVASFRLLLLLSMFLSIAPSSVLDLSAHRLRTRG